MKVRSYAYLFLLLAGFVLTVLAYYWFFHSPYYSTALAWANSNVLLLDVMIVAVKVVGIIWPPLPGIIFSFAAIPALGWVHVFLVDSLGNILGCAAAYWIARRWGLRFLEKIVDVSTVQKLQSIRTVEGREIEGLVILRVFSSTVAEVTCYGAGVLRVRFRNFLIAVVLSNFIVGIPLFYFADRLMQGGSYLLTFVSIMAVAVLFYVLRKRYFHAV